VSTSSTHNKHNTNNTKSIHTFTPSFYPSRLNLCLRNNNNNGKLDREFIAHTQSAPNNAGTFVSTPALLRTIAEHDVYRLPRVYRPPSPPVWLLVTGHGIAHDMGMAYSTVVLYFEICHVCCVEAAGCLSQLEPTGLHGCRQHSTRTHTYASPDTDKQSTRRPLPSSTRRVPVRFPASRSASSSARLDRTRPRPRSPLSSATLELPVSTCEQVW